LGIHKEFQVLAFAKELELALERWLLSGLMLLEQQKLAITLMAVNKA
jgi:hypothetical protein